MSAGLRGLPRGSGVVHLEREGGCSRITFDNPARHNALSPGMMHDLEAAVSELEIDPGVSVILSGARGGSFCAGGDLVSVREHLLAPGLGAEMCAFMQGALQRLCALPVVIIGAVEGAALGGGAELLTACDRVFASEAATVGFVQAALGVSPGWGGGARLVERVGRLRALIILTEARRMTAAEAAAIGLIEEVVPAGHALSRADRVAAALSLLPPGAVQAAVRVARSSDLAVEARLFAELWGGSAHRAALGDGQGRGR